MKDMIIQLIIGLTGGIAIGCLASLKPWRRWGYIIGMLGQPCWFYVTYENQQWAMLALAGWYTWVYYKGILDHWIRGPRPIMLTEEQVEGWEFTPGQRIEIMDYSNVYPPSPEATEELARYLGKSFDLAAYFPEQCDEIQEERCIKVAGNCIRNWCLCCPADNAKGILESREILARRKSDEL